MEAQQKTNGFTAKPHPPKKIETEGQAELEAEMRGIKFDANLRCDRCGARAYSWILLDLEKSSYLSFCGHHFNKHKNPIKDKFPGALIVDRTGLLAEDRKKGQL